MDQNRKNRILEKFAGNQFGQVGGYQAGSVSPLANRIQQASNYLQGVGDRAAAVANQVPSPMNALGRAVYGDEGWAQSQRDNAILQKQFKVDEAQGRGYEFGPSVNRALRAAQGTLAVAPLVSGLGSIGSAASLAARPMLGTATTAAVAPAYEAAAANALANLGAAAVAKPNMSIDPRTQPGASSLALGGNIASGRSPLPAPVSQIVRAAARGNRPE